MPRQGNANKKTSLNAMEQYELNQWLEQNHVNANNLRRSFTDVLPLARLLSRYYPELIDLNYYPPRNSVQNKLCNWESFNKRVLMRLGVHLTREQMVRVARSVPGSVDLLLFSIMRVQMAAERKAREEKGSSTDDDDEEADNAPEAEQNAAKKNEQQANNEPAELPATSSGAHEQTPVLPMHKNMPKTLKLAQAALKRSEMLAATHQSAGVATAGILQRARRLTAAGNTGSTGQQVATSGSTMINANKAISSLIGNSTSGNPATTTTTTTTRGDKKPEKIILLQQNQQQQRMVLYSHYQQAVKQLQLKNDKIARFDQLSAHLENMLHLKCERIDELQQQVATALQLLKPKPTAAAATTAAAAATSTTTAATPKKIPSSTSTLKQNARTKRLRLKRRFVRSAAHPAIPHKMGTIAIPGIGISGANFPVKLSPFH